MANRVLSALRAIGSAVKGVFSSSQPVVILTPAVPGKVKGDRRGASVAAELALLGNAQKVLVQLAPFWDLPPDLLAEYLEKDAAAKYVLEEILPLMPVGIEV